MGSAESEPLARVGSTDVPPLDGRPAGPPDGRNVEEPSLEERREAVELLLHSASFDRADQLRRFLRYVCDLEFSGRGSEVSEYLIGVEALGKPAAYSTTEDSSVRRAAHALRRKLEQVYAGELSEAPVRVELPLGGYQPRFHRAGAAAPASQAAPEQRAGRARAFRAASRRLAPLLAAFVAGAVLAGAVLAWRAPQRQGLDPIIAEAWGPLARPGANPLVCLSAPPHYGILAYPDGPLPPGVVPLSGPLDVTRWWRQHYPLPAGYRLATHLTSGPIRLGEVLALVTALRTLDNLGVSPEVVAEKYTMLPTLRKRNLLLLGNPEYSHATSELLGRAPLTVTYDPVARDRVVASTRGGDALRFAPTRDDSGTLLDVVGLVTVLPGDAAAAPGLRTIIVSCTNAGGCEGAMEFISSPSSLRDLRARFRAEGQPGFPAAYQVVVRSRVFLSAQATAGTYEAHVTFQP